MTVPNWLSRTGKWLPLIGLALIVAACDSSSSSKNKNDDKDPVDEPTTFETERGAITGWDRETYNAFLGIPYAKPPVGELRFAPPEAADSIWDGEEPWAATEYGNICPQIVPTGGVALNEDCLYLNVYMPADMDGGPYPVMVWIHGGAFIFGDGGPTYLPKRLVEKEDVVVVTLNYRLGILGLLAHDALSAEQHGASGAYSLMDQQLALKWVQDNISAFGGDPNKVTIFGESAGAFSVLAHVASPKSEGLFHRAIAQSGSYEGSQRSQAEAMAAGAGLANGFGCGAEQAGTMLECLRSADVADILAVQAELPTMTPAEHDKVLPLSLNMAFAAGEINKVPVMSGSNRDEWSYFLAFGGTEIDESNYVETLEGIFALGGLDPTALVSAVLAEYDLEDDFGGDAASLVTAVGTDAVFACPAMGQHSLLASEATYVYWFVDRDAPPPLLEPEWLKLGATHAAEIQYIFGDDAIFAARGASAEQVELANTMTRMWADFARHGDPNPADGTITWSTYTAAPETASIMSLDAREVAPTSAETFSEAHRCEFWGRLAGG